MANNDLMRELDVKGTPAVFYKDSQGKVRMVGGLPAPDQLGEIMGPRMP
jgi:thiol:disulfide interchange protein DsbG